MMPEFTPVETDPFADSGQPKLTAVEHDPFEAPKATPQSWTDVASSAVTNAPASAAQFGHDIIQPILHPIDTATNLASIGYGILQKHGLMSGNESVPYADAVGKFVMDRYGSVDALKNTIAHDPVGLAADLSMLISGGGTVAARAPGLIGRAGEVASTVGRTIDPLSAVASGVKMAGRGAAEVIGGLGTQTGAESLRLAGRAGYEGGEAAKSFRENMRGTAPIEDTLAEARGAVQAMRDERGGAYRSGMADIGADTAALDFSKIDGAIARTSAIKNFKGQDLSPTTQGIRQSITDVVNEWRGLDPKEFHTAEGLDALKQKIGDIRDATKYGTPERVVANNVYHAVRNTIIDQVPQYAKVMKGYEEASKQIKAMERELSLNPNANVDTALRKLQSVLRNNVNTGYGRRAELADFLVKAGAPNLMYKLAGQSLQPWTARGLGKLGMQLSLEMAAMGIGHAATGGWGLAAGAATLPFMSPRLVGEVGYYGGKVARKIPSGMRGAGSGAYQAGRLEGAPRAFGGRVSGSRPEMPLGPQPKNEGNDTGS